VKECREVDEGDDTVTIKDTFDEEDGDFSYGPGSADLDYPISPLLMIHRLSWRLVFLCRREGCTVWCESVSPRS
jgi:hypothetical protein